MSLLWLLLALLLFGSCAYRLGSRHARNVSNAAAQRLDSLPVYHGMFAMLCCTLPAAAVFLIWLGFEQALLTTLVVDELPKAMRDLPPRHLALLINDLHNRIAGNISAGQTTPALLSAVQRYRTLQAHGYGWLSALMLLTVSGGFVYAMRRITLHAAARQRIETVLKAFLLISSTIAVLTTVGIVLSMLFETIRFFKLVPITDFLFGLNWSPQTALRSDQVGSSGSFGFVPLFLGTLLIAFIAMLLATPLGLFSAIYLSEYASPRMRAITKPMLEILAGIPTVVYGFFAALTVAPLIRDIGQAMGLNVAAESALAAGLIMGVMIIPLVSSLSDDAIRAVPQNLRDGSYALGATQSETIRRLVIPAALHGIIAGLLLAVSRAIGETMIVVMAAGLAANLTVNPLQAVTTVTVQIVTLLVGDQEFDSAKTLAAFALGLTLFVVTLFLNLIALTVTRRYREKYE